MKRILLCGLLLAVLTAPAVYAQKIGLSAQATSMGPGLSVHLGFTRFINVRASGYLFSTSVDGDYSDESLEVDIGYDADISLGGASAIVDFYPRGRKFHLSAGIFYNMFDVSGEGAPTTPYEFNDVKTFQPDKLGTITVDVKYPDIAPYVGLGFGNVHGKRISFNLDMGVLYSGAPTVDMEGTGLIAGTATQDEIINDGIESFVFYPYISLGLGLRLKK